MRQLPALAVVGIVAIAGAAVMNAGALAQDVKAISRSIDKAARSVAAEADKIAKDFTGTKTANAKSKRKSAARKGAPSEDGEKSSKATSEPDSKADDVTGDGKETAKFSSSPATTLPDTTTETKISPESAAHAATPPGKPTDGKPADGKSDGTWPKTLPDAKAEAAKKPPPVWSEAEISEAKAHCEKVLKTIEAVTIAEAPVREGLEGECGTPAPIKLISLGKNPQVSVSPPALITCDLAVALHTWLENDIQPLAKSYLGAEVIRIETMSDYSCRKAYGRVGSKLSEHGKANALDIRGFVTAKGQTAYVLDEWGMTQRDIEAQIAAAKATAEKIAAEKAAAEKAAAAAGKGLPPATVATPKGTVVDNKPEVKVPPVVTVPSSKVVDGKPSISVTPPATRPSLYPPGSTGTGLGFSPPSNLGGPKAQEVAAADAKTGTKKGSDKPDSKPVVVPAKGEKADKAKADAPVMATAPADLADKHSRTQSFMRDVHARGCKIFGTILGPEANEAHRNHFHVDLAPRKRNNFCE